MSWMQKLYETHAAIVESGLADVGDKNLFPESHTAVQAQIEIVLNAEGEFQRAGVVDKADATTLIPCTEASATRGGKRPVACPLCDKLQYVAADFRSFGGEVTTGFARDESEPYASYVKQLQDWVDASPHPMTRAVLAYVRRGSVVRDLVAQHVLPVDAEGMLIRKKGDDAGNSPIWSVLPAGQPPQNAVVRWRVEVPGRPCSGVWEERSLLDDWSAYYLSTLTRCGLCMVSGEAAPLATLHPLKLRNAGDKAKLISANDSSGFTFRGRFTDASQACGVSYEVSQKAHSVLRWLIARQGYRNGTQVFVSWAVSGKPIPQPLEEEPSTYWDEPISVDPDAAAPEAEPDQTRDIGQNFALRLKKYMKGYADKLDPTDAIVIMGLDSATPGRMSITYYRELLGSEFLPRLQKWHADMAWPQRFSIPAAAGRKRGASVVSWRVCAPVPKAIAVAAYGRRLDDKLKAAAVERLVPCIVDGRELPADLVKSCTRRVTNRPAFKEKWEWEQALGVACAMYRGYYARCPKAEERREYKMALEPERTSRDYLFGRLLAVAERIEEVAQSVAGEERPTTAARLMQHFADHPCATWASIELALQPYMQRLQVSRSGFLHNMRVLLDGIIHLFQPDDFISKQPLSGEFLLGYHCQRQQFRQDKRDKEKATEGEE